MKNKRMNLFALLLVSFFFVGCATRPSIAYLAVKKPEGIIKTVEHGSLKKDFERGGIYFYWDFDNFRPAPDVASYLGQVSQQGGDPILRNADVKLTVPDAIDFFSIPFGYDKGTDTVTEAGK